MSGQPNRYANSAEMYRNQYMDALNSRANVDDFNLQANKNFKATGSLPPSVTQQVDNRTTTEILADTEKLKLNIISELKPVMNSGTASVVVQKIQTAPANADGSFLVWTAQNIPEIVKSLRKKYALGIKGDAQDATNIVIFLSDMYSKIKDYTGSVKSYFDTTGESKTGLKEGDLDTLKKEYEVIVARLKTKFPNYKEKRYGQFNVNNLINKTTEKIQGIFDLISSDLYKTVVNELLNLSGTPELSMVNGLNDSAKLLFEFYDKLPSISIVRTLYRQLDSSIKNQNPELSVKILDEIYNLFPDATPYNESLDTIEATIPPTTAGTDWAQNVRIGRQGFGDAKEGTYESFDSFNEEDQVVTPGRIPFQDMENKRNQIAERIDANTVVKLINKALSDINNERTNGLTMPERRQFIAQAQIEFERLDSEIDKLQDQYFKTNYGKRRDQISDLLNGRYHEKEQLMKEYQDEVDYVHYATNETKRLFDILLEVKGVNTSPSSSASSTPSSSQSSTPLSSLTTTPQYSRPPSPTQNVSIRQLSQQEIDARDKIEYLIGMNDFYENLIVRSQQNLDEGKPSLINIDMGRQTIEENKNEIRELQKILGITPSGAGFKKKRRGRPKGSGIAFKDNIDHDKGIQPVKKYHPFGKYFVNSHKLNHGNVLSIRSKSGTNVREYPSRTVSPHMASIVKTIIGGGVPSYNDMEKLTEDEKDYLYKVSKRAEFADKISIPTPSKDKMEKDIHEFEVCKGEIMAGNDSKELIKKFKLLIIRLSKNGTIPKREAMEVMTELLELGY